MISLLITTFLLNGVLSHGPCGFDAARQRALDNDVDGSLHTKLAAMESHFKSERHKHEFNAMVRKGKDRRGLQEGITSDWDGLGFSTSNYFNGILEIPVVVHILYNPNYQINLDTVIPHERIQSQIKRLNQDYSASNEDTLSDFSKKANYKMSFKLHKVIRKQVSWNEYNLDNTYHKYDSEGGSDVIDAEHYLNIYVVVGEGSDGNGGMTLGICTFPGSNKNEDGCTLCYKAFGDASAEYISKTWKTDLGIYNPNALNGYTDVHGTTATHEVGHYLNLQHPWGNKGDWDWDWHIGKGSQTCWSDTVFDTPTQMGPHAGCPTDNDVSRWNDYYYTHSCDGDTDQYMNYMDYTNGECRTMFTKGQLERTLSMMNKPHAEGGRQELVDYQSKPEHSQGRFVNDLYFTVTSETTESKICGPSDELVHDFEAPVGNKKVYACVSTTDNSYVDVISNVYIQTYQGNNCIATLEDNRYACFDKVSFTDSSRMTIDDMKQKLLNLFFD